MAKETYYPDTIEEEYFHTLCTMMMEEEYPEDEIEDQAHRILDAYSHDGVLDTYQVDSFIDGLLHYSQVNKRG